MIQTTFSARQIFRLRWPKGSKNFMTPEVIKLCKISRSVAVELSTGAPFLGCPMFGVTALCMTPSGKVRKGKTGLANQVFNSQALAERHINRMAAILKGGR